MQREREKKDKWALIQCELSELFVVYFSPDFTASLRSPNLVPVDLIIFDGQTYFSLLIISSSHFRLENAFDVQYVIVNLWSTHNGFWLFIFASNCLMVNIFHLDCISFNLISHAFHQSEVRYSPYWYLYKIKIVNNFAIIQDGWLT